MLPTLGYFVYNLIGEDGKLKFGTHTVPLL